MLEQDK